MASDTEMRDGELPEHDSLASTAESDPQEEYEVETILAENKEKGEYLVKWAGYPENHATWQGPESFDHLDETMKDWKRAKREIKQGLRDQFDVSGWERDQERLKREKKARQRNRKIKRAQRARERIALLNRPDPNLAATLFGDDEQESSRFEADDSVQEGISVPINSPPGQDVNVRRDIADVREVNLDVDMEDALDPPVQSLPSKRPASVASITSNVSSLFVSEVETPPPNNPKKRRSLVQKDTTLFSPYDSEQSGIQDDENETHQLQLQQELEQRLGQQPPRRARQSHSEQDEELHLQEGPQSPQPRRRKQPVQEEQPEMRPHSQHQAQPTQQPPSAPAPPPPSQPVPPKPPSAPAPPPTQSLPKPTPSTFGVAPKLIQTARPRRSKWDEREPNVNELDLRKPSQYSARGEGADSKVLVAKRLDKPSSSPKRDDPQRPRAGYNSCPPIREDIPLPHTGDSYRPVYSRTKDFYERRVSPDDGYSRGRSDMHPRPPSYRPGSRLRSRSPPRPNLTRSSVAAIEDSRRPCATERPTARPMPTLSHAEINSGPIVQRERPRSQTRLIPTRAEMSAQDHIAEMPVGKFSGKGGKWTSGGYFWNWGEALAHVFFGPEKDFVGAVRICGLGETLIYDLISSKDGKRLEMWFEEVYTKSDYDKLCDQTLNNDVLGNAWMEGFRDTNPSLFEMTEYLRVHNSVAIYRPPKPRGNAWLVYSRRSTDIASSLNCNSDRVPASVPAFIAVRPPLPSDLDVQSRPRDEPSRSRRDFPENVRFRRDGPMRHASFGALPISQDDTGVNQSAGTLQVSKSAVKSPVTRAPEHNMSVNLQRSESRVADQSVPLHTDPRLTRRSSISKSAPQSPTQPRLAEQESLPNRQRTDRPIAEDDELLGVRGRFGKTDIMDMTPDALETASTTLPAATDSIIAPSPEAATQTMLSIFRENYKITLEELSTVSEGSRSQRLSLTKEFYLHPCAAQDDEARKDREFLEAWLKAKNPQIVIFSDWEKFVENCPRGVIMFHDSFTRYDALRPRIRKPHWSSRFNFWNYRLSKPLQTADPFYCAEGANFQLIFPFASAYLLTEDVFKDLKRAATLVYWFSYDMTNPPKMNKLMLSPGIMQHLERQLDDPSLSEEDEYLLLSIIIGIQRANSIDPRRPVFQIQSMDPSKIHLRNNNVVSFDPELIPNWGSRREKENPEIPRGLTQDERNTDHLVELFAAWTLLNKAHIRKTVVITSVKNKALLERWEEWGHVALYSQNTVIEFLRIRENDILAKIWGKYKQPGESGSSLPATTPKTPVVDPRTPRAPWDSRTGDGPSSPKETARHNYPAPYR